MEKLKNKNIFIVFLVIVIVGVLVLFCFNFGVFDNKNQDNSSESIGTNHTYEVGIKMSEEEALSKGRELYDKVTEIYEVWRLRPYCGLSSKEIMEAETVSFPGQELSQYYASSFQNLAELKSYLSTLLSKDIIDTNVSDTAVVDLELLKNSDYFFANYVEIDGKLYCRKHTGKGWLSSYLNHYDISVQSIEENKITYDVRLSQLKDGVENSKCSDTMDVSNCNDDEIEFKDTSFGIEKDSAGNWVVFEYSVHD